MTTHAEQCDWLSSQPSDVLFAWMNDLDILADTKESAVMSYWFSEVSNTEIFRNADYY